MIETGLQQKVVIVTGAASGIGRATADRFAAEGCRVARWDIQPPSNTPPIPPQKQGSVPSLAEHFYQQVDVTNTQSVESATSAVIHRWGSIHALINNAGVLRDGQLVKFKDGEILSTLSDEQFDSLLSVNLRGVFVCTRAIAPHLIRARQGGVILNASSVVGLYGNFGQTNYVASKAGVIGMTRVWARELGRYNIRVNAVAPGFIATDMIAAMPEKILDSMRDHTPLRRLGQPEDIANAYLWLASDAASFVTGTVLSVDGGVVPGT